jgi:hypothetical protein
MNATSAGVAQLLFEIVQRKSQSVGNRRKIFLHRCNVVAKQQDAEGRIVVNEDAAVAVEHSSARRDDGDGAHAIALRHDAILVRINDLKFPEAQQQKRDHAHDHVGGGGQPFLRQSIIVAKPVRHARPAREPVCVSGLSGARSRKFFY